jgi:tRNA (guanine37-N1)-methyltransferase
MMMQIDIVTAFPGMFQGFLSESLMSRALAENVLEINVHDLRDFADDPHRTIDDTPFGGGGGMILKAEPIARAVETVGAVDNGDRPSVCIVPTPRAPAFCQSTAVELSRHPRLVFVCGHYTGMDERVLDHLMPRRYSVGDYVLSGGELPTMVMIDAVARQASGFLGNDESARGDSFVRSTGGLGTPHYTRPAEWRGRSVPAVLLSGHHAQVAAWRDEQASETTRHYRPDLVNDENTEEQKRP